MTVATDRSTLTGTWTLDVAHTTLGFAARHAMVSTVRGSFKAFSGELHIDGTTPSNSTATVTIDAASISTNNEQRDGHLKSPDFFDVEKFPTLTFVSTAAEQTADDTFQLAGDLTIHGVTKPVVLDLEYTGSSVTPYGTTVAGFEGKTTISRKEWGLEWNVALEAGGIMVGDKVKLTLDVEAVKQA